jgi:hypothetical protein
MQDSQKNEQREEVYSRVVKAGNRTYFFDVKETRHKEKYLTITESKRRFSNETGRFFYEKHKIFLYSEDFEKFIVGLNAVIEFVETGVAPPFIPEETIDDEPLTDLSIDDLEKI